MLDMRHIWVESMHIYIQYFVTLKYVVINSPQSGVTLCFQSKPFKLNLRYLGQRKYRSGKMYWMTFGWSWPKVTAVTLINKNLVVCRIKWEPLNQSLQKNPKKTSSCIPLVMVITWLDVGGILLKTLFWKIFFENFGCVSFTGKHSIGHEEWLVRLMWN